MQSEFFDRKIKEAADHHHPAYDENAWGQMEGLLNKHMPVEKDRDNRYFFLLLFLLIGISAWVLISQPWKNTAGDSQTAATNSSAAASQPREAVKPNIDNPQNQPAGNGNNDNKISLSTLSDDLTAVNYLNKQKARDRQITYLSFKPRSENVTPVVAKDQLAEQPTVAIIDLDKEKETTLPAAISSHSKSINTEDLVVNPKQETKNETPVEALTGDTNKPKNKAKSKKPNYFFFYASAGPDMSFAGNSKWGDTRLIGGLGAGYSFSDRVTLRTGFFSSRKIYSAAPDEYNPPPQFWTYYPNLQKVDADCSVYEIPLSVSYHIGKSDRSQWLATTGLSTYLMKEENYNYFYKYYPSGPTVTHAYKVSNKNNHLFSVLTLSAGYKRKISSKVSLAAEPYFKIPLSGVGYGKVKLNSGGILFTVGVSPFSK